MTQDNDYELTEDDLLPFPLPAVEPAGKKRNAKSRAQTLTQRAVDRAQPREKEYSFYDKSLRGFGFRMQPSGSASYGVVYKIGGKSYRYTIGNARLMRLDEAKEKAIAALRNIREYGSPDGHNHRHKKSTLNDGVQAYRRDHYFRRLSPDWQKRLEYLYLTYVEKKLGNQPIASLKKADMRECILAGETIHIQIQLKKTLSSIFTYFVETERTPMNIIKDIKLPSAKSRDHVLTDKELAAVWHATYKLRQPFGECGRFLMLSGQRRTEVSEMEWEEVDLKQKIWKLPEHRSKNRHAHTIPLTKEMVELLSAMPRTSKYVFESTRNEGHAINGFSKIAIKWQEIAWAKDWRIHDLRRTVASGMGKIGIQPHVIEAVLGHRSGVISGVAAVYNRYNYEKEKREALERWQAHLLEVAEKHKDYVPEEEVVL